MDTKKCVLCGNLATMWTGHVHTSIGLIAAGHCNGCNYEKYRRRERVSYCTSPNKSSCYGEMEFESLELKIPLTAELLAEHSKSMEFSRRVDNELHGLDRGRVNSKKIHDFVSNIGGEKKNSFSDFVRRIFFV